MMMMPPVVTECMGASVVPLAGDHTVVISDLEIGTEMDGFDLDGDMMPDNKLALVNQLAGPAIRDALDNFELMLPIEFFDFASVGADDCVKFGIYLGHYRQDLDGDGNDTANDRGDCNDLPGAGVAIFRGAAESCDVPEGPGCGDRVDNDCDGKAEEVVLSTTNDAGVTMTMETASSDTGDIDLDGVSVAAGDCDDHDPMIKPGLLEVCRDGLDNDCDGHADFGMDQAGMPACTPYDDTPDEIDLDPLSFLEGQARISFKNGKAVAVGSNVNLEAGPSVFGVNVPIADGINLDLRISNTMIVSQVAMDGDGVRLSEGRLGGVLDAYTLDQVRGLEIMQINLRPEDSMLDAMFANVLGLLLSLEKNEMDCLMPDIDIDKDGLEAFCDTNPDDMIDIIDLCIDGDGTMIADGEMGTVQCTEAMKDGKRRFVDGVSIEMNFAAVPVILPAELP
jgi:hypothetical protein